MTDVIWFSIYLGMFTGVISVGILLYATFIDLKRRRDE